MFNTSAFFRRSTLLLTIGSTIMFTACSDNDDDIVAPNTPNYEIPATYNFANTNYSGQSNRLDMLAAISNYIKTAHNGAQISATRLKAMYANNGAPFTSDDIANFAELNAATTKQLKDKTFAADQAVFEAYFDSVEVASQSTLPAGPGQAGVSTSITGASPSKYLLSANGVEYNQLIQKQMMGAVFYYQVMEGYLTDAKIGTGVDNTTITAGEGTAMEHHFDEAFGYFGAPKDFPGNQTGTKYWANYSNQVNPSLNSNKTLMDAFLKGRAAISNKDMKGKDEAVAVIRKEWERVVAASAIRELNSAKTVLSASTRDQAKLSHYLSEAMGFVKALRYKSDRVNTDAQINSILNKLGTNFYQTSLTDVNAAINEISTIYGMDAFKDNL